MCVQRIVSAAALGYVCDSPSTPLVPLFPAHYCTKENDAVFPRASSAFAQIATLLCAVCLPCYSCFLTSTVGANRPCQPALKGRINSCFGALLSAHVDLHPYLAPLPCARVLPRPPALIPSRAPYRIDTAWNSHRPSQRWPTSESVDRRWSSCEIGGCRFSSGGLVCI